MVLKNQNSILPLASSYNSIAVVGPFAHCSDVDVNNCYLHSYNGVPSFISTVFDGISAAAKNRSSTVKLEYQLGCNATCPPHSGETCWHDQPLINSTLNDAAKAAAEADITFLVVGLGAQIEAEGRDRANMTLNALQRELGKRVASSAKKLVVIIVSAGGVALDETDADAVVQAWWE